MFSWTLWRELRYPPKSHPLYWRIIQQGQVSGHQWWVRVFQIVAVLILAGVAAVSLPSALTLIICGIFIVPVVMFIGSSGFYASLSAMDTADVLAQEARDGTHDLLRVTPAGAPAVDWLMASACLNRNQRLTQAHQLVRVVAIGGGLALGAVSLFLMASVASAQEQERLALTSIALTNVSRLTALCFLLYLDHMYSFTTGGLVGIVTAYTVRSPLEARVWAFIGFWTQQIMAYALVFGLILLSWSLMERLFAPSVGLTLLMSASILLFYAVVRESMLAVLWRWMLHASLGSSSPRTAELR